MTAKIYLNDFLNATVIAKGQDTISPEKSLDGLTFSKSETQLGATAFTFDLEIDEIITLEYFSPFLSNINESVDFAAFAFYGNDSGDFTESTLLRYLTKEQFIAQPNKIIEILPATQAPFKFYRFVIQAVVSYIEIFAFSAGRILELPEGIQPSYTPPHLAIKATIENNITMGGNFVGRSLTLEQYDFIIKQDNLSPDWIRANWLELLRYIQAKPFLYLWDDTHPEDMVYCWTKGDIPPPIYNEQCYMSFSFDCNGFIERA